MEGTDIIKLKADEIASVRLIWHDLKQGIKGAHERLEAAPDTVRAAILEALIVAMDKGETVNNPFG